MTEATAIKLVGVAIPTLRELRSRVLSGGDTDSAVNGLREAGYAGGEAVYDAFEQWLDEAGDGNVTGDLALSDFGDKVGEFFRNAGWGDLSFWHDESEGIAMVDIENCWESEGSDNEASGCHITTGVLAAFFGRVAGYPVSVMENECSEDGRCRFVLGNAEVMQYRWESLG
jgi:predicted hydrocarbon binding protein